MSPSPKRKSGHVGVDYYTQVDEVFKQFCIDPRSPSSMDAMLLANGASSENELLVPLSVLSVAMSKLRLIVTPHQLKEAVAASKSGEGLARDEFVSLVHKNLHSRTTAEEVIFNAVQLDSSGDISVEDFRSFLLSDALRTIHSCGGDDHPMDPLTDSELNVIVDKVDTRGTGVLHVGCLVRVMCPDESEEVIEGLLEKYGVGESRRQAARELIEIQENIERECLAEELDDEARTLFAQAEDSRCASLKAQIDRETKAAAEKREREERERRRLEDEERRRRDAEEAARKKKEADDKAAAEQEEKLRREAAEIERRRREKELLRIQQEKAQAGCCRVQYKQ